MGGGKWVIICQARVCLMRCARSVTCEWEGSSRGHQWVALSLPDGVWAWSMACRGMTRSAGGAVDTVAWMPDVMFLLAGTGSDAGS